MNPIDDFPISLADRRDMTRLESLLLVLVFLFIHSYSSTTCAAQSSSPAPQIFFTDLDSAPNSGGESVSGFSGAYVTLYGDFFGASQVSSTVTLNGQNCLRVVGPSGAYTGWGMSYFWYQKIIVQLGSGCTPGSGNFVVTVNGAASNGIAFAVRSTGTLRFVSTKGSDSNTGTFASPFASIPHCKGVMKAGDVCYIEVGVKATTVDNFDATLELESGGTAGNPVAFAAYPGATVTLGNAGITYGLRVPNINVSANFVTIAGLFFSPSDQGMDAANSTNWRIVGNNFQCPNANGQNGCFTTHELSSVKFLGNETTNVGVVAASKQQHADYFSSDTNHVEAAWNYVHDNRSCRAIQFHSSPLGGGGASDPSGHNQFDLSVHDNLIHDDPCDGINFATIDPSQGKVEAYNNVIYHVGIGPAPQDGDSGDYSCIYIAYITNTGPVGGGTVEVYNNTLYDCGAHVASFANNGSFMINGGEPTLNVKIRNNVMYQLGGEPFGSGGGWNATLTSGSNNVMHSTGSQGAPAFLTGSITSDPLFLDLSLNNFHLQSSSPAKDAGITISSSNTFNNYTPWSGNPTDYTGVLRPQGANYDIGAYEFFAGSVPPPPPTLQSISVTPSTDSVAVGGTVAFVATGHYSDGSSQNITTQTAWSSSSSSVATVVSNTGVATGVTAGGPVTITALLSGTSGTASLTVSAPPPPTLQTITVTPSTATVAIGGTVAFTATGHYSDGSSQNVTTQAAWSSSSSSVATVVSNTGVATGVTAGGPVTITASLSGINGTAPLTVSAPPPPTLQTITVAPGTPTVAIGGTVAFTATGHYSDGSSKAITTQAAWSSSSSSVATVISNTGVATGVAAGGPVTITASLSGISGTASLTVNAPPPPTLQTITAAPSTATVAIGGTVAFTATGHYSDGSSRAITTQVAWSSSSSTVATIVSNTGVATGVTAGGPVTITASLSGISGTASLTVSAPPPPPTLQTITVTPNPGSVTVGNTVAFTATGHYSDGSSKNITTLAAWSSGTPTLATIASNTGVASGVAAGGPVTITASLSGISGTAALTVTSKSSVTVVNFDSPAPTGSPYSSINGVFQGIDFGANQWDWEPAYLNDTTNNIYFSSASGNTRTFKFASGSHMLISMKVATSVPGTLTLSDGAGQTKTQTVSGSSLQLVTTGWKNASSTITVTFTAGWNIEFDDITYQ